MQVHKIHGLPVICTWTASVLHASPKKPMAHNSFIPLACAECDNSLPFSGASSIPLCYVLFPAILLHQLILPSSLTSSCHLFLDLALNLVVPRFIHNTFLEILFSSLLCTCPNQHNLFNLVVSIIVGFPTLA